MDEKFKISLELFHLKVLAAAKWLKDCSMKTFESIKLQTFDEIKEEKKKQLKRM